MDRIFKQYGIWIVGGFFSVLLIFVIIFSAISVNKYKKEVVLRDSQIQQLDSTLNRLGDIQTGYVVTKSVRANEKIDQENIDSILQEVDVPTKLGLNVITNKEDILNKYFRTSLKEGSVLTVDNIVDEKIDSTFRYFDLVIDELPIGLKVGDHIDVRITFPFSQDFIAIANKKVEEINGGIAKVVLSESEIYAYQSMLMDKALYSGTKIYAVKYYDAGAQPTAEVYYPLNKNLAEISSLNPNLLELVKQEMIAKRTEIDNNLGNTLETVDEFELEKIQSQIELIRNNISRSMADSQTELSRRLEEEARQAALAAGN